MSNPLNHIAIIDYGMGNLHSVSKALQHVGENVKISVTADPTVINSADRVVFPGVGAIGDCMSEILRLDIGNILKNCIHHKPVLAICVGMQALLEHSEESGGVDCLKIVPGKVRQFDHYNTGPSGDKIKVPHMGWNAVEQCADHPLWNGIEQYSRFYFVHSYYAEAQGNTHTAAYCDYGVKFAAAMSYENLFAVQFHPEKSAKSGLQLLRNFSNWVVQS